MKILIIILAAVFMNSQAKSIFEVYNKNNRNLPSKDLSNLELKLQKFNVESKLEKVKQTLRNGNETLGVPVCDPFELKSLEEKITLFNGTIKGSGSVDNLLFTGLSWYEVIKADFSIFSRALSLKLKWPHLEGTSFYIINAFIKNKMIEIYGGGDFQLTSQDLIFETVAYFGLRNGNVYIKKMDTKMSLGDFKFTITGLYYDDGISETMSTFVSEFVKQVFKENQEYLVNLVNSLIIVNANKYLSNMTIKDLIDLLG